MSAVTTIEMRLQVELQRKYLSRPGPLPDALQEDLAEYPALLARHRWGIVRAADLVALLQPWSESDAVAGERCFKVAGTRHELLLGLVDEPWVQVLVDDGTGQLSAWRGRQVEQPLLTIIGRASDLTLLEAPRTVAEIERVLRRGSALATETDWMLASVFGVDHAASAAWLATLAVSNPAIFLALIRRDVAAARKLLRDEHGDVAPDIWRQARRVCMIYEIMRLVELLRAGAGPDRTTADGLIATLATVERTTASLKQDNPLSQHIGDGWMFMSTLCAFAKRHNTPLSPAYPLVAYGVGLATVPIGVASALQDPATFDFYGSALRQAEVVAGTSRTLVRIDDRQPVDFYCGVEQMRLAVVALRAIARKSGHPGALNHANRAVVGRLALHLLRVVDPAAFDAYADHWSGTHAVKAAGLTRRDLEHGLTDPDLGHDLGTALVIKTEQVRRFVGVSPDSTFDPFRWGRQSSPAAWASYHEVARGGVPDGEHDGDLTRDLLRNVIALGTELKGYFVGDAAVQTEAVALCQLVGAHHTPLARDPALFSIALRQINAARVSDRSPAGSVKLSIVPRAARKMIRLARRGVTTPAKNAP